VTLTAKRSARRLRQLPLTAGFACAVAAAEVGYASLSSVDANRVADWASTNVARLTSEPIGPLIASMFIIEDYQLLWLALGTIGCALVEARFGWRRTLLVGVVAQFGGTAVSQGIVWWRVGHDRLPHSALHQVDVGMSYVVAGLLTAAVIAGRPLIGKAVAAICLVTIGPNLLTGLTGLEVSPVGHLTAFLLAGIFSGVLLVRADSRPRIQDTVSTRTQ